MFVQKDFIYIRETTPQGFSIISFQVSNPQKIYLTPKQTKKVTLVFSFDKAMEGQLPVSRTLHKLRISTKHIK